MENITYINMCNKKLTPSSKILFNYILVVMKDMGQKRIFIKQDVIAKKLGCCKKTIYNSLNELIKEKFIEKDKNDGRGCFYKLSDYIYYGFIKTS